MIEDNIQDFLILENYENKETLRLDRDVCTNENDLKDDVFDIIYDKIKNYLMENGYLSSYHEINEKVGDSIFEEIRYDLNILLSKYILEAYDLLLNNSGNLINKPLFLSITKLENIELGSMVVNILYLIKYYGLNNKLYETLVYIIDNKKYYLLLDEIQEVKEFESVLIGFMHMSNVELYVTGSNSKFLSSDIVTEFRGRGDEIRVYPLSFDEFFSVYGESEEKALNEYYTYGGLPLTLLAKTDNAKTNYLKMQKENVYISY